MILLNQTEAFGDRAGAAMIRDQIGKVLVYWAGFVLVGDGR
jgi:hypothetical protein